MTKITYISTSLSLCLVFTSGLLASQDSTIIPDVDLSQTVPILVLASITPGKPNADTEQIMLKRNNDHCVLIAVRSNPNRETIDQFKTSVNCAVLSHLWRKVLDKKLLSFNLQILEKEVFDFGVKSIRLEWSDKEFKTDSKTLSWTSPIVDEADLEFVFDELAVLVNTKKLELFYF